MVLGTLGKSLESAWGRLRASCDVNEEVIEAFLKEVCTALIQADVQIQLVAQIRKNLRAKCIVGGDTQRVAGSALKRKVYNALYEELLSVLTPTGTKPFTLDKGRANVVMFVGLQGAGKTTTCTKFAHYYRKRGWKVAMVCADTYRAGAFDQLKQNAAKVKIPFYGSYTTVDAVEIASKGVMLFKKEKADLIIVDTSGRHKQEDSLFEEMRSIDEAVKPDKTIFVMDSHIGQACASQAKAFKDSVDVASVIVTKLDGHAKGGGALTAVATTGCPISFIGLGEGFEAFEVFDGKGFISRLMGMGDPERLVRTIQEFMPETTKGKKEDMMKRIVKSGLTYDDLKSQLKAMSSMGSIGNMVSMIPGMSALSQAIPQAQDDASKKRFTRFLNIIDSMRAEERNLSVELDATRKRRLALGSGAELIEVEALIEQQQMMSKLLNKMGKGMASAKRAGGNPPPGFGQGDPGQLQNMMFQLMRGG